MAKATPREDEIIVPGDFNTRVASDYTTWGGAIGRQSIGRANSNELLVLSFCAEHNLTTMDTVFQLKECLKVTRMHLKSKHWYVYLIE